MKKALAVILVLILALSLVPAVLAAPAVPSANKVDRDFYWVGFMSGRYGFSGQAPDDVVHYVAYINGYLDKWEYEDTQIGLWGYRLTYDEYMGVVDSLFANHSDMKDYLTRNDYLDPETGIIDFLVGGFGDSVDFIPLNTYKTEDTYTVYGIKVEMAYEIEEGHIENYDYYMNNGAAGQILDAYSLTYVLEDGQWKISAFNRYNLYLIDGVLYNRGYSVDGSGAYNTLELNNIQFNTEEGAAADLADVFIVEFAGKGWYYVDEAEYGISFPVGADEGYELVSVVLKDNNGAKKINPVDGVYTIHPEGDAVVTISANPVGEKGAVVESSAAKENVGGATIDTSKTNIVESVLTEEELEAIEQGEDVAVFVTVEDIKETVAEEQLKQIEQAVKKEETVALVLDINLYKQIGGYEETKVKETNSLIKIDFVVPEEFRPASGKDVIYKIARIHEGELEILEAEYNEETFVCSFYTDKFSTYALIVAEKEANPKTADMGALGAIMAMAISAVPVIVKKRNK